RSREQALAELAALGMTAHAGRYAPAAVILDAPASSLAKVRALSWLSLEGEASQLVALLVGGSPGERILDACAAPGGKTLAIAGRAAGARVVVAADVARAGVRGARGRFERADRGAIAALVTDARRPPFAPGSFDAVLVDAPCSGLGTLRSHPEIRWR